MNEWAFGTTYLLMNVKFKERFELELEKLAKGITLKSGIKNQEKVQQKIGRLFVANFTFCPKNNFIFLAATDIFVLLHNIGNFIPSHF